LSSRTWRSANKIAEGLRDQGLAVDVAYDGLEASAKLNLNPYDVVVLDRDLPGIDSVKAIAPRRACPQPVSVRTGHVVAARRRAALLYGCSAPGRAASRSKVIALTTKQQ
jgi:DNA-binding response OmpR family regulator